MLIASLILLIAFLIRRVDLIASLIMLIVFLIRRVDLARGRRDGVLADLVQRQLQPE